jgi:hypothetical protein
VNRDRVWVITAVVAGVTLALAGIDLIPPWSLIFLGIAIMAAGARVTRRRVDGGVQRAPDGTAQLTRAQVTYALATINGFLVAVVGAAWWAASAVL